MDQIKSPKSSTLPCAACKYQRRKCPPTCPLAPYFPSWNYKEFQNARRLFGVSNMSKALTRVKPNERDDVAKSLIFEANTRALDPVGGCTHVIRRLQYQIQQVTSELNFVLCNINSLCDGGPPQGPQQNLSSEDIFSDMFQGMPTLTSPDSYWIEKLKEYDEDETLRSNQN